MLRVAIVLCLVGAALCGPPVSRTRSEIEKFRNFLESTRTDRGVRVGNGILNPDASAWQNSGKYQGDILLDEEQVESLVNQFSQGRAAYIWPGTLWPSNTVVYEFASGAFNQAQMNHILYTMSVLEDRTCIRFRQRMPNEFNYALITGHDFGCYASVGYWASRGVHTINLSRNGCLISTIIIHEWLHVIGFFHMQSAHVRDNYVRINWENMDSEMAYNFDRFEPDIVSQLGLPYEYDSIMHYNSWAFSINGLTTMDALRPHTGVMGQIDYVTGYDFWRVDRHYGCSPWRNVEDYKPFYFKKPSTQTEEEVNPKVDE